ncbi:hypothetical protein FOE67_26325, partial [Streptomyces calidiresistens]|nr:hypothetical protein [Streptomyces calidiresistens]
APPRQDPWRRTSGMHKVRRRRQLAAVRELWWARDAMARERDLSPGKVLSDAAIVAAAQAMPRDLRELAALPGFGPRMGRRRLQQWLDAVRRAAELPESELPQPGRQPNGPPPPRAWAEKDPAAAARLTAARTAVTARAEELNLPQENLLTPDTVRRLCWEPPAEGGEEERQVLGGDVGAQGPGLQRTRAQLVDDGCEQVGAGGFGRGGRGPGTAAVFDDGPVPGPVLQGVLEELAQGPAGVVGLVRRPVGGAGPGGELPFQHGAQQVVLGGEVAVEGAHADAAAPGDLAHVHGAALLGEHGVGGLDDRAAVAFGVRAPGAPGGGRVPG